MAKKIHSNLYSNITVDVLSVLSTSSLALKIFRSHFLKINIPIIKENHDKFIRHSYFGGATDYYKAYGENLYYYDVNSLYPYVMLKDLPLEIIEKINDLSNIKLKDFFGFALAEITCPENIQNPLLPFKHKGNTIFPKGV